MPDFFPSCVFFLLIVNIHVVSLKNLLSINKQFSNYQKQVSLVDPEQGRGIR